MTVEVAPTVFEITVTVGREDPLDGFARLGLNVTSAEPYERAAETFDEYLDEI